MSMKKSKVVVVDDVANTHSEKESRVMPVITNEEAILRLARDENDGVALIAVAENSSGPLRALLARHFSGRERRKKALLTLLVHISWHAKEFVSEQDASRSIEEFAEAWCRNRSETHGAKDPNSSLSNTASLGN